MLALTIIALASCSKEQSSLNIEDVPGKAKIMGTLAYDAGQGFSNGVYTQLIKAAANTRVVAKVSNSSILSSSKGYTIYETLTDENGNYSIEVPADYDGGVSVQILADPFFATYSEVVDANNNTPKFETKEVLFKLSDSQTFTMSPNGIQIYDASYSYNDRTILEAYKYTSTFVVMVGEGRWSKLKEDGEERAIEEYKTAANKNVLVHIDNVCYSATTNNEGKATFIIPSEEKTWTASATIEVPGYVSSYYDYYKKEFDEDKYEYIVRKYTIVNGTFEQIGHLGTTIEFSGIEGTPAPIKKIRMRFTPFEGEEDYGYYWSDKEWEDDTNS